MLSELAVRTLGPQATALDVTSVHLHGAIITPDALVQAGTVVVREGRIREVSATIIPAPAGAIDVETNGLMCPGFVDTHNHAAYAGFPRWTSPARYFQSRFDWRGKTRCGVIVVPQPDPYYRSKIGDPYKLIEKAVGVRELMLYGQVRGIIGGATTMVVDADLTPKSDAKLPGFVRDPGTWPGRIWGVLDVGCVDEKMAKEIVEDMAASNARLLVHLGEGTDAFSRGEFLALSAKGLLTANTALIHAMALLDADWRLVSQRDASIIWSPVSNFRLYGRSIDIGQALGARVRVALAPDWTISGSSTVLDELAFVRQRYGWIPDSVLLDMVTRNAADAMGMPTLGRIAPGALADLLILPGDGVADRREAARRVVSATPEDLRLAVVDGTPVYGVAELMNAFPAGAGRSEMVTVPLASGGSMARALRTGEVQPFAETVASLTAAFHAQQVSLAPLWEPT